MMTGVSQQTTLRQKPAIILQTLSKRHFEASLLVTKAIAITISQVQPQLKQRGVLLEFYKPCSFISHLGMFTPNKSSLCSFVKGMALSGVAMRADGCGSPKIMAERAGARSLQGLIRCWKGGDELHHQPLRAQGGC